MLKLQRVGIAKAPPDNAGLINHREQAHLSCRCGIKLENTKHEHYSR